MFESYLIVLISVYFFKNICCIPEEGTATKMRLVENLWTLLSTLYIWLVFGNPGCLEWRGIWMRNVNEEERSLFNGGLYKHMEWLTKNSVSANIEP